MHNHGLGSWPVRRARMSPTRVALSHEGREWTYAELAERVGRLAVGLARYGVGRGDRVGYLGQNDPMAMETMFAAGLLRGGDVALLAAPLFHIAALAQSFLPLFIKGGRAVVVPSFDADRVLRLVESERIASMFGVPTTFATLARSPLWEEADLSSLRILECGGALVPDALIETYQRRGLVFLQGYGMTEAAPERDPGLVAAAGRDGDGAVVRRLAPLRRHRRAGRGRFPPRRRPRQRHDHLGLARFKIPKYVQFVADLPRTASGKLRKAQLRDRYGDASPAPTAPKEGSR